MNRHRAVKALMLLGLGLLGTVAISRAQSARPEPDKPTAPRALRERLVQLRSQVEVLQLEHDADMEDLNASLKSVRTLRRDGLPKEEREALGQMALEMQQAMVNITDEKQEAAFLENLTGKAQKGPDKILIKYLKDKGFKNFNYVAFGDLMIEQTPKLLIEKQEKEIAEKTVVFTEKTARLNALKLELEEAEHRYADTR